MIELLAMIFVALIIIFVVIPLLVTTSVCLLYKCNFIKNLLDYYKFWYYYIYNIFHK